MTIDHFSRKIIVANDVSIEVLNLVHGEFNEILVNMGISVKQNLCHNIFYDINRYIGQAETV